MNSLNSIQSMLADTYIEYCNDYLTATSFADHKGVKVSTIRAIIVEGKLWHEYRTTGKLPEEYQRHIKDVDACNINHCNCEGTITRLRRERDGWKWLAEQPDCADFLTEHGIKDDRVVKQ